MENLTNFLKFVVFVMGNRLFRTMFGCKDFCSVGIQAPKKRSLFMVEFQERLL
ncbi:TIR-NBS-LRR RCT1-like resistance protein [Corchorus olitorius]|uniref:TIR-NBS-LRR RCT1-like resistance protein n=1 Tax=Corchorus olitorius TaxID=93759 RepID=A0A1R3KKX3_9ROSI|nr:TIR-NBS-LRR RCT1-like resistance protein [Corchorus olitorius]